MKQDIKDALDKEFVQLLDIVNNISYSDILKLYDDLNKIEIRTRNMKTYLFGSQLTIKE